MPKIGEVWNFRENSELQSRIISPAKNTEGKELLEVIDSYSEALNILDDYDHQCLEKPKENKGYVRLEYE